MSRRLLFVFATIALAVAPAFAQIQASRWGSIKGLGFGAVNRATLDNHFEIPIYSRATVGNAQLNLRLTYDSQFWTTPSTSGYWEPAPGFGWRLVKPYGSITADENEQDQYCGYWNDTTQQYDQWWNLVWDDFTFTEPDGTVVSTGLPVSEYLELGGGTRQRGDEYDCTPVDGGPTQVTIPDGKGYTIVLTGAGAPGATAAAYDASGDRIDGGFTDPNGNTLTVSSSGGNTYYGDPLGSTAVTQSGSGTPASPVYYTYTGPSGGSTHIEEQFENLSITTSLGCGTHVNWSGTATVPSEIDLPDGRKYTFGYDSNARLISVTLPTGAAVYYSYTVDCSASGATDTGNQQLKRWDSINGSAHGWVWNRTQQGGGAVQTVETDPYANDTVFNFAAPAWQNESGALTEADFWQGTHGSGTELESITYNNTLTDNYVTAQALTYELYQGGSPVLWRQQQFSYADFGGQLFQYDYDWGTCATCGALLRNATTSYTSLLGGVMFVPAEVTVSPNTGSGGQIWQANYSYDSANGNLLNAHEYVNATTYLTRSFTYNSNGAVATAVDTNGGTTTYTYTGTGACNDTRGYGVFPTGIQSPVAAVATSETWNCTGGVPLTSTDANGQVTTLAYADAANDWRPSSVHNPDGSTAYVTYPSGTSPDSADKSMTFNGGSSIADTITTADGLGRAILSQRRQGPTSSTYDIVQTTYDYMDRPVTVSAPYAGALNDMTGGGVTTTAYDALSRPLSVTDANGGYSDYSYAKNDVLLTLGPAPTGENTKRKQEEWDGLDRLKSVCELTSTANGGGTCAQSSAQTGYWTEYTRNPLGQITAVTQNAQGTTTQSRSFGFDWLGRLTSESNPEDGTTSYTFDTDATCGTSDGDMVKRADNAGNVTCYSHDALHRVTKIKYPTTAAGFSTAPEKEFIYGTAKVDGVSMANVYGKLSRACTVSTEPATPCDTTSGYVVTDLGFSYPNPTANEADVYQSSPNSGGYYVVTTQHYANGAASALTLPGVPAISYGVDGEGRSTTVSASSGQNPATAASYSALGLGSLTLGSGDSDAYTYDSSTGRMTQYQFTVGGLTDTGALTWNTDGSLQKLQITDNLSSADTGTCSYTHDDLGRIAGASCGTPLNLAYSFDPFGNVKTSGSPSALTFNPTYTGSSNRISGETYDNDGNLKDDPVTPATGVNGFDADGQATTLQGITVTFNALGRAVEAAEPGGTQEFLYGPSGDKLAVMSGQTLVTAYVPLPGGSEAVYKSSGLAVYHHSDWEGSARLASTPTGTLSAVTAFGPYGEVYAEAGTGAPDRIFTGQKANIDSTHSGGQFDFPNREYNPIQGRWWTPDPGGLDAADPEDPQSWNKYAYVVGRPLELIDPSGFCPANSTEASKVPGAVAAILGQAQAITKLGLTYGDGPGQIDCTAYINLAIRRAGWTSFPHPVSTKMIYHQLNGGSFFEPAQGGPEPGEVIVLDAGKGPFTHAILVDSVSHGRISSFYASNSRGPGPHGPGGPQHGVVGPQWSGMIAGGKAYIICLPNTAGGGSGSGGGSGGSAPTDGGGGSPLGFLGLGGVTGNWSDILNAYSAAIMPIGVGTPIIVGYFKCKTKDCN